MRNIIIIIIIVLLFVSIAGCKMPQNELIVVEDEVKVTENMEDVITQYIEEQVAHQSHRGTSFSAQEFYGTKQKDDGEIYVYLWTYYSEYYLDNGELQQGGGASLPLIVVIKEDNFEEFYVVEHFRPLDGSEYDPSVRSLFPEKYHDRIFTRNNVRDLEPLVKQKAEAHFKEQQNEETTDSDVGELFKELNTDYDNFLHVEQVDHGFIVFYETDGKLKFGYLKGAEKDQWQIESDGTNVNLISGGYVTTVFGETASFLTYGVATNPDVHKVLVKNEPATQMKSSEDIEFWFAFTDENVEDADVNVLNEDGEQVDLSSYEHIQVAEEDQKVDINIMLNGTGSQSGLLTFIMNRSYENGTGSPLHFEETIFLPGYHIFRQGVPSSDILSLSEGLTLEETQNGYQVSGEVQPFETKSITLLHQYDSALVGGSKNKDRWNFGQTIDLYRDGENTKLNSINVHFNFPPSTTDLSNELSLGTWDDGAIVTIDPDINDDFLSISWALYDKETPTRASIDAMDEELNLAGKELASVSLTYSVRVNSLPHYLTYLAIGIGLLALVFSYLIYRKIKKTDFSKL